MVRNIHLHHLSVAHLSVSVCVCLCVCRLSIRKVYYGKTADWIWMPFRVVSGVGRLMGVLDGVVIVEEEGAVLGVNLRRPTGTSGDFVE